MTDTDTATPWGSTENFDPEKAWTLIQNLRGDVERLKADKANLVQEHESALHAKTEADKALKNLEGELQTTVDTAAAKERDYAELATLRTKENLLIDAGLPRKYAPQVIGEDEEAWRTAVQSLTELRGQAIAEPRPDPAQAAEPQIDERTALAHQLFGPN